MAWQGSHWRFLINKLLGQNNYIADYRSIISLQLYLKNYKTIMMLNEFFPCIM